MTSYSICWSSALHLIKPPPCVFSRLKPKSQSCTLHDDLRRLLTGFNHKSLPIFALSLLGQHVFNPISLVPSLGMASFRLSFVSLDDSYRSVCLILCSRISFLDGSRQLKRSSTSTSQPNLWGSDPFLKETALFSYLIYDTLFLIVFFSHFILPISVAVGIAPHTCYILLHQTPRSTER